MKDEGLSYVSVVEEEEDEEDVLVGLLPNVDIDIIPRNYHPDPQLTPPVSDQRMLVTILASPRFPDGYYASICRILDATGRIRITMNGVGEAIGSRGAGSEKKISWLELKGIWCELDAVSDVISSFRADVALAIAKTEERLKSLPARFGDLGNAEDEPGGDDAGTLTMHEDLFELLNLDDVVKGMQYISSFTTDVHMAIISHILAIKVSLSRLTIPLVSGTNNGSTTSIQSFNSVTALTDVLEKPTHIISSIYALINSTNRLLRINERIKHRHLQVCRVLQEQATWNLSDETKPTKECIRNLCAALQIVRSVKFPEALDLQANPDVMDIHEKNNEFYGNLVHSIRGAAQHIRVIEEFGWSKNMDTNKDALLPFYLELMTYTRGIVDESPLSKLGCERGIGVGEVGASNGGMRVSSSSGMGTPLARRLSLGASSIFLGTSEGIRGGFRDILGKTSEETDGVKKRRYSLFSGIWKWGMHSTKTFRGTPLAGTEGSAAEAAGSETGRDGLTKRRRSVKLSLSNSFASLAGPVKRTKSVSGSAALRYSDLGASGDIIGLRTEGPKGAGLIAISEERRLAQEEWEDLAMMLNGQKCMCKTGWMAGTTQHLRGRAGGWKPA